MVYNVNDNLGIIPVKETNNFEITLKHSTENLVFENGTLGMNNGTFVENGENCDQKVPFSLFPRILDIILMSVNHTNENIASLVFKCCFNF